MSITSASPEVYFLGTDDKSKRLIYPEPQPIPQHTPLQFLFTRKGPTTRELAVGGQLLSLYGEDSFDKKSKYFNHSTIFANGFNSKGNLMMVHRLIPDDAGPKANMTLYIDVAQVDVPNYLRNADGSLVLDTDVGGYKVNVDTPTISGYEIKYIRDYSSTSELILGIATSKTGTMKNKDGSNSTMYPILDIQAKYKGEYYNNVGIAFDTYIKDDIPSTLLSVDKIYPYKVSLLNRKDPTVNSNIVNSKYGESKVMFSLKEDAVNSISDKNIGLNDVLDNEWKNELDDNPKVPLMYHDFNNIHMYNNNIKEILTLLATKEQPYMTTNVEVFTDTLSATRLSWYPNTNETVDTVTKDELYLFNILTLKTVSGVQYQTVVHSTATPILTGNLSEVQISPNTPLWLGGSTDGTMDNAMFEKLIVAEMDKYLDKNSEVMDLAVARESILYDSGFTLPTKKKLINFIGVRPNTIVMLSTFDATIGMVTTLSDERATAAALVTKLRMLPESSYFGTGVMRSCIVGQSGVDKLRVYKQRLPQLFDYAMKAAELMGAGNGKWKDNSFFDKQPGNIVSTLIDVQPNFLPASVKPILWDVGIIWSQKRDRKEMFYPASQTAYDNDTSVLNNFFMVSAIAYINTLAYQTWQRFTGDTSLDPAVFKVEVEAYMNKLLDNGNIFLNKFDVVPEVYLTDTDKDRGYSWHLKTKVTGNTMKTVMTTHVEAFRKEA